MSIRIRALLLFLFSATAVLLIGERRGGAIPLTLDGPCAKCDCIEVDGWRVQGNPNDDHGWINKDQNLNWYADNSARTDIYIGQTGKDAYCAQKPTVQDPVYRVSPVTPTNGQQICTGQLNNGDETAISWSQYQNEGCVEFRNNCTNSLVIRR